MNGEITVHKLDATGNEIWQYQGRVLFWGETSVRLAATFDRQEVQVGPLRIEPGDLFIETFYSDRWYNTFAVFGTSDQAFRGWYCNIARPARIEEREVHQEDLALDLIVLPTRESTVLDRDEFDQLALEEAERSWALSTLNTLRQRAEEGRPPFDAPPPIPEM
jgi:hypothetical protein